MSFSDKPREPRTARRARPRQSLKMQAIGFLSRREYSRQELRAKLLDSVRKRAREDAALAAATEAEARALAEAIAEQPSNGIDDAFAPPVPGLASTPAPVPANVRATHAPAGARDTRPLAGGRAAQERAQALAPARRPGLAGGVAPAVADTPASIPAWHASRPGEAGDVRHATSLASAAATGSVLATLTRGDGGALPHGLRARLDAVLANDPAAHASGVSGSLGASRAGMSGAGAADDVAAARNSRSVADAQAGAEPTESSTDDVLESADPEVTVDQLLDWLVANKYLNETRFVESRVNARSRKQGTLRIKLELSRHGLAMEPEQVAVLRETEFARAHALWQRKFGAVATEARERAKQGRFLASRGFASDVVRRVVGGLDED